MNNKYIRATSKSFGTPDVIYLEQKEIPKPQRDQFLVKIHAATVSTADVRLRSRQVPKGFGIIMGLLFGFSRPRYEVLGTDLCGEVVEVGDEIKNFKKGDRVIANLGMKLGGHAQYKILSNKSVVAKVPENIKSEEAAALVFGGTTALVFLRDKLKIRPGDRLLVVGAGGAVGSAAVQLGVLMGAEVTGVCSTNKVEVVKKLGIKRVIDYEKGEWALDLGSYDAILETVGAFSIEHLQNKLRTGGRIGLVVADLLTNFRCLAISAFSQNKIYAGAVMEKSADLEYLLQISAAGSFTPLIGQVLPFDRIIEAHQVVEKGHKLGNLVLRF